MKRKGWITSLFLILLTGIAVLARMYYIIKLMPSVEISEELFHAAKVSADPNAAWSLALDGFGVRTLYACSLHAAFILLGNFAVSGVYLNMAYQVLTVLLVFAAVKNVSNRYIGLAAGLAVSVLPVYIRQMQRVTPLDLMIALGALLFAVVTEIIRGIVMLFQSKKKVQNGLTDESAAVQGSGDRPLADTSMKEILPGDLEEKKINYIENPLPTPKRREHKEMDFTVTITDENDGYDLNDLSGKDFYDIQ